MLWLLALVLIVAIAISGAVYWKQDELIFYPQPLNRAGLGDLPRSEPFELDTADGTRLRGWLVRADALAPAPLLIYFGGNAEEVSWVLPEVARVKGWSALVVNYRGYGESGGAPSERALFADAIALYDRGIARPDVDRTRVVAMGRSLGTGVATWLASQRPLAGVVLVSPYDSLIAIAQKVYPFLPVRLLLKHRFDSISRAPSIRTPLLALAASRDTLIPPESSRRLVQAWGGPARLEVLEGRDHNDIHGHPLYWSTVGDFLAGLRPDTTR
jgi:pimeloyl-ACP methyl ester carboxylesterase